MRTLILGLLIASTAVVAPASAEPLCEKFNPHSGICDVFATSPTEPPASVSPDESGGRAGGERVCVFDYNEPEVAPCITTFGPWIDSLQSWCMLADPQPPKTFPAWEGHTDGAIYDCVSGLAGHGMTGTMGGHVWLASPPDAVSGPDPRVLAEQAVAQMPFQAGQIGMTPLPGPDSVGVVGVQTWLWIADPGESTTGPMTRSASAEGITVTATATLDRIEWSMGDDTTITCTPYQRHHGGRDSPDCGYTYTRSSANQPDHQYTVTATSFWTINWTGGGASGTLEMDFSRSTPLRIGEIQTLLTRATGVCH